MIKGWFFDFSRSIRLRLVLSTLFVALLAVGLMSVLGTALIHAHAAQREEEVLALYGELARVQVEPLLATDQPSAAELKAAVERIARLGNLRVRLLSPAGEVIADSGHPTSLEELQRLADEMARQGTVSVIIRDEQGNLLAESGAGDERRETIFVSETGKLTGQAGDFSGAAPIVFGLAPARSGATKTIPVSTAAGVTAQVEVSEGQSLVTATMDAATRAFRTAGWAAVFISLLVGLAVSMRLSTPLVKLTGVVKQLQAGDRSARVAVSGGDELARLAAQFNAMAEQIETSFDALQVERDTLRRFVSDASHELRTPITALKMFAELLDNAADDPIERAAILEDVHIEVDRLAWITSNLLDLSRMDAGILEPVLESCLAVDLLKTAASAVHSSAVGRNIDLVVVPEPDGIHLSCDRRRIEMALVNLLENAVKFTPCSGWVRTGVTASAGDVTFWVKDSGPGIVTEDLPHVFERFYRGADRSVPGSGLGLAIVKSVAELHRGVVEILSLPGEGVHIVLRLPRA
ncbi:MAG TPA: HAMP domain-containing sensor histidine kinase [Anaerolineaceae bacterium]|nr:HAMP domain-containing sensor histidine kinase [Anaerolineaceae bacterium]